MKFITRKTTGALLCLSLSYSVMAQSPESSVSEKTTIWLSQQINQHPEIIAAKAAMQSLVTNAKGQKLPIYNPELETGYEQEGSANNYAVGINQTLDWWDKQDARTEQANFIIAQAKQNFHYLWQTKVAQALQALIVWRSAKKQADIALAQEQQLGTLLDVIKQRQKTGDLGEIDAELTFLSLSQRLNQTAQAQVALEQAQAQVKALLPNWQPDLQMLPQQGFAIDDYELSPTLRQQYLNQHPLVLAAKAQWQNSQSDAQLAALNAKADPTVGVSVGETDRETTIGLSFSMPLNIRNNYSAQINAANQQALSLEANLQAILRQQKFAIQASTATVKTYQKSYLRWQKLMQGRDKRSETLLTKQWQSGDISTPEYLLALSQRAEGLYAGIELEMQFKLSQIEWLLQLGQINTALKQLKH